MNKSKKSLINNSDFKLGFENKILKLPLDKIIYSSALPENLNSSIKFKKIISSIREVGIIEPPVIATNKKDESTYILLDGHLRIEALKRLNINEVDCLVSLDDESFTYNKFINRLSPIQEHRMILKAVEKGVSEIEIANALNLDVASISKKRNLLKGICPEVIELLKDKVLSASIFAILRKMKPVRQIAVVSMMETSGNYSLTIAKSFLAATTRDLLVNPNIPKNISGINEEQILQIETEMSHLQKEYKLIEDNYSNDVLNLTLAKGYLSSILENARIVKYLSQNNPDILKHFQRITEINSI
jgi:hypothetical protein